MPQQIVRAYQAMFKLPPAISVMLMLIGLIIFVASLRGTHHARSMENKHTWAMVIGGILFFVGLFPIITRLPGVWPAMQ